MRGLLSSIFVSLALAPLGAVGLAGAEEHLVEPPPEFASDAHRDLYETYGKARRRLEQTLSEEIVSLDQAFARSLKLHMLRIAGELPPERTRELKKAALWWFDADGKVSFEGDIPAELETAVEAHRSAVRKARQRRDEHRRGDFNRLIRGLDALALEFESDGDLATMHSLRGEARALMPRRGLTQKWGEAEVTTYHWAYGDTRFVRMQRGGDPELVTLSRLRGMLAGGGESAKVAIWDEGTSPGLEVISAQGSVEAAATAIRDKRLELDRCHVRTAQIGAGDPRKKLIHRSRGFCYLGGVWGNYSDLASCEVSLDPDDGFYYLSGRMESKSAGARAVIVEYHDGDVPDFEYSTVEWKRGETGLELIDASDGVCVLTGVSGAFRGRVEEFYFFVGIDGKWRLGGVSDRVNTGAKLLVIKYKP